MSNRKVGYISPAGEVNIKPTFTESAGYRTARQQIESFMYAGALLQASRSGSYDSEDYEPVEDPSLDMRDMELSDIGHVLSQLDAPKVVKEEETGASVSSSPESEEKSFDKVEA